MQLGAGVEKFLAAPFHILLRSTKQYIGIQLKNDSS